MVQCGGAFAVGADMEAVLGTSLAETSAVDGW